MVLQNPLVTYCHVPFWNVYYLSTPYASLCIVFSQTHIQGRLEYVPTFPRPDLSAQSEPGNTFLSPGENTGILTNHVNRVE